MNSRLNLLQPYPFARLGELLEGVRPATGLKPLRLAIGEPRHSPAKAVIQALTARSLSGLSEYPATGGSDELKSAIARWLNARFGLNRIDAGKNILPVNGTREALFAVAQALADGKKQGADSMVLMPNPFYQIYEGAALLAGSSAVFYNLDPLTNQPDFGQITQIQWQSCELMYVCTPGNPAGQSLAKERLKYLIEKARKYNFILVSDECYSELFLNEEKPCASLLQACEDMPLNDYKNCLIFHSLSKRSNLPGLRSGFVAGDASLIAKFLLYRTYHGSAMPLHHQSASTTAWEDEEHVENNRELYRAKYRAVVPVLKKKFNFIAPDSGFYLWLETPIDDRVFVRNLYKDMNLLVVPGSFLAREANGANPGRNKIRLALVGDIDDCIDAAHRLCSFAAQPSIKCSE